jgi:L-2-hydroxyglutarate oxidase LhgO
MLDQSDSLPMIKSVGYVFPGEGVENLAELPDGVHGSYKVKTDKGKTIEADIIIKCIGLKVNSAAYASSLSKLWL